ncbi:MAG TPA: ABC transporter ATP-binding protein [Phycisphaerales bacterium]|nr:ABC transporter ATP-binding protein [Phycisphaerales bacterium]
MIEVSNLHRWFGSVHAVRGVDFTIPQGQIVGLLGPNGAGKTTTLRLLTGILRPQSGSIRIAGTDALARPTASRRAIGYLPESAPSYPEMSVRGFLRYRSKILPISPRDRIMSIEKVLGLCRLSDVARRRIGQLSKGYRQRVALAASLLHDPPVLILDEPTNGLDPTQVRDARSLIADLARNRTVIVSSHILPEIERTCGRLIIIGAGRVLADGTPEELRRTRTSNACIVQCRAEPDRVLPIITRLGYKAEVEPIESGWFRLRVRGSDPAEARARIGAALTEASIAIRELRDEVVGLEELFVSVLESAEVPEP